MFSRALIVFSSLALLAVATPWNTPTTTATSTTTITVTAPAPTITTASQCPTSEIQCCQSTEAANSVDGSELLTLLGIVLEDTSVLLGVDCSPITIIGGTATCDASPVCCTDNSVGDFISIGCIPVSL